MLKTREIAQGCAVWVIKLNFNIKPLFIRKTGQLFDRKFLTY